VDEEPNVDLSQVETKLDSLDQTMRQLLAEVSQLRTTIDNALD